MLNRATIQETRKLCEEVAKLCNAAERRIDIELDNWNKQQDWREAQGFDSYKSERSGSNSAPGVKENGTLRRRSMDLTRQLSKLRSGALLDKKGNK